MSVPKADWLCLKQHPWVQIIPQPFWPVLQLSMPEISQGIKSWRREKNRYRYKTTCRQRMVCSGFRRRHRMFNSLFNFFHFCLFYLLLFYSAANSRTVKCVQMFRECVETWGVIWQNYPVKKWSVFCALHCPLHSAAAHQQLLHLWHSLKRSQANS